MSSYATLVEATEYIETRIGAEAWYDAPELPYPIASYIIVENPQGDKFKATVVTEDGQSTVTTEAYDGDEVAENLGTWAMLDQNGVLVQVTVTTEEGMPQFQLEQKELVSERMKALITATRALDRLNFVGTKAVASQTLQFPREGSTEVPENIKIATIEEALSLLEGRDPNMEYEGLRMYTQSYANVKTSYDPRIVSEHVLNGITSTIAWRYIKPYLRSQRSPRIERA